MFKYNFLFIKKCKLSISSPKDALCLCTPLLFGLFSSTLIHFTCNLNVCDLIFFLNLINMLIQLKTAISRATSRNDVMTIRDALEVSAEMYKKDANHVSDYIQRHLISLSIWEELRYVLQIIFYSIIFIILSIFFAVT